MAEFRLYRTYRYIEKNPVIDRVRTIVQDEGLYTNLTALHEISGVSTAALDGWFHGTTKNPQHGTIAAVITSLGYEEQFIKKSTIDIDKERKAGKAWLDKREKPPRKKRTNGAAKKGK